MLNRVVSFFGTLTMVISVACGPSAPLTPAVASSPMPPEPAATARPAPTSAPAATPTAVPTTTAAPTAVPTPTSTPAATAHVTGAPTGGPASLQMRIARSDVIARVRLASVRQTVESFSPKGYQVDPTPDFGPALEYTFEVREYLKGSGGTQVMGIALDILNSYATEAAAEAANLDYLSTRDAQWDGREAIVFLMGWSEEFGYLPVSIKQPGRYFLGDIVASYGWDTYTIASALWKNWLPAVTEESTATEYMLDIPDPYGFEATPAITLTDLKAEIARIDAEVAAGDGTSAYEFCIYWKYVETSNAEFKNARLEESGYTFEPHRLPIGSGLAAGSLVDTSEMYFRTVDLSNTWIEGADAHLFEAKGMARVAAVRPLPAGEYHFTYITRLDRLNPCDAPVSDAARRLMQNVVVASAPEGVLHEAFFDPVTVGTTVAADDTNGQLHPATFTRANGSSATLEAVSWETGAGDSGTVKVEVDPDDALAGHVLDFIELDGTVSLSLDVFDAAVDTVTNTLTWSVSSQPWHDGDLLMVRIREAPPSCSNSSAVANPGSEPALVSDCEALLGLKDDLAGTASLNWSLDRAIASWAGVTVGGTPERVTRLDLTDRRLTGELPAGLGALTGLRDLHLAQTA